MGRGDAGSSSTTHHGAKATPRNRNKITHKTRLRIVHGDVEADRVFGEDEHDGKALATGVDAEDANEYHLLAVLAASQQPLPTSTFCQPSTSNNKKAALVLPAPPPPVAYIPTPDATGKVDNYADFYPELHSQPSSLLAKASETLEEGQADSLAGGYAYVMDERDSDWLERNNKLANGEGPSNSASTPRGSRSAKARGKEPELPPTVLISEDEFELVMGLFEKHTDEKFPYLHLSPTDLPPFSDYEAFFSVPVPPHFFPSFIVPQIVPPPPTLYKYARIIYPYWRERKVDRGGRRIIPQLNYDETNESDPYVCFRRRMPKPLRKTRRQDSTSLDRLSRLSDELRKVMSLAQLTLQREQIKQTDVSEARSVAEARVKLIDVKKKAVTGVGGAWLASVHDDELFVMDLERPVVTGGVAGQKRKPANEAQGNVQMIRVPRRRDDPSFGGGANGSPGGMVGGGMLPAELHQLTLRRLADMQHAVDREVSKRKDGHWEDVTENAYQPTTMPFSLRHFRTISSSSSGDFSSTKPLLPSPPSTSSSSSSHPSHPRNPRSATALRLRVGRGGRTMLDRRPPRTSNLPVDLSGSEPVMPPLPRIPTALQRTSSSSNRAAITSLEEFKFGSGYLSRPSTRQKKEADGLQEEEDEKDFAWKMDERWKYDSEAGLLVGGAGLAERVGEGQEDPRLVVDDFEHNTFQVRKVLLLEEDFSFQLRTDDGHLRRADMFAENRREAERIFATEAHAKALVVRREMAARQPPPPPPPPTPNGNGAVVGVPPSAAVVLQMKKQAQQQQQQQQQEKAALIARAGRPPHPLAISSTPAHGVGGDGGEMDPESADSGSGSATSASHHQVPTPMVNGVPLQNGKPVSSSGNNGVTYLQPPPSQQQQASAALRQSASPMMMDSNGVGAGQSSSPTPATVSLSKPISSASASSSTNPQQQQSQPNGIPLTPMTSANGNIALQQQPSGNMNAYSMMPMVPNGYPMMNNGASFPPHMVAAFNGNTNAMATAAMQQQFQRMAAANAHANGGQPIMNGTVNGNGNGLSNVAQQQQQQQQMMMMGLKNVNMNGTVFAQQQQQQQQQQQMNAAQAMMNGNGAGGQQQQLAMFPQQQQQMNLNMMAAMNASGMGMNNANMNGPAQGAQVQNLNLSLGNGNIPLKLPAQRAMQWAAANGHHGHGVVKGGADGMNHVMANGVNGHSHSSTSPQRQQNSSSPAPSPVHGRASPANAARLNGGGGLVGRNSPHLQAVALGGRASPNGVNGVMHPGTSPSPRMAAASHAGSHMPSPLAASQQIVGGAAQQKVNGY